MSDVVANLKAELQILDGRIQAERNDEVRHALQRGRLEAERAQLLVKLMEAAAPATASAATLSAAPYRVVMSTAPFTPTVVVERPAAVTDTVAAVRPQPGDGKRKPEGLPSVASMIKTILQDGGLRPRDITTAIRQRFWPDISGTVVGTTAWHMAEKGRLAKSGSTYSLPAAVQANGHGPRAVQ